MRMEDDPSAAAVSATVSRQFSIFSLIGLLAFSPLQADPPPRLRIEQKALSVVASSVAIQDIMVFLKGSPEPVFGVFRHGIFIPAAPFVRGQSYKVRLSFADGSTTSQEMTFGEASLAKPTVHLSPATGHIPANTLKLYLDFSEPMEQGVFLRHLMLQRRKGEEVVGAFRETELWSPDGKRLTVLLHPGRQKTGVNLQVDEGPVLLAGEPHWLVVSGQWRSTSGVQLGKEVAFRLEAIAADHNPPDPTRWQVQVPKAATMQPLVVITDELFEPQIFQRALQLPGVSGQAEASVIEQRRLVWHFKPVKPWPPGEYEVTIDPDLEDLAGNTTQGPFEVNLTTAKMPVRSSSISFCVPVR